MNSRLVFIGALSVFLSLAGEGLAADRTQPNQYQSIDLQKAQAQLNRLKKDRVTPKDLNGLSAEVHGVDILPLSSSDSDIIPASSRPTGNLQLDKVVIVDPSK